VLEGAQGAAHEAARAVADVAGEFATVAADAEQDVDEFEVGGQAVLDAVQAQQLKHEPHVDPGLLQVLDIGEQDHAVDTSEQTAPALGLMAKHDQQMCSAVQCSAVQCSAVQCSAGMASLKCTTESRFLYCTLARTFRLTPPESM
jgi:hypothetical protein